MLSAKNLMKALIYNSSEPCKIVIPTAGGRNVTIRPARPGGKLNMARRNAIYQKINARSLLSKSVPPCKIENSSTKNLGIDRRMQATSNNTVTYQLWLFRSTFLVSSFHLFLFFFFQFVKGMNELLTLLAKAAALKLPYDPLSSERTFYPGLLLLV